MYLARNDRQTATLQAIPDGIEGTAATLKAMRELVRDYKRSLPVRQLAVSLVREVRSKDWLSEIRMIHQFVRDHIRYVKDINGVETLQTPEVLLQSKAGDCDDKSTLAAALLESIGHPTRFVAVGFLPDNFAHVYAETKVGNKWVSVETTEPVEVGWTPPNVVSRMVVYN